MTKKQETCWIFAFGLESATGEPVDSKVASELLEHITAWAENRDYQIGGGYRPPRVEDSLPGPIFETDGRKKDDG